jgi:dGTPase
VASPGWALGQADAEFPLELSSWPSLEAQVAAISDDIAYDNHDIDDGLRAGLFSLRDVLEVPFVARHWEEVKRRYPDVDEGRLAPELIRDQIGRMVNDVLQETARRTAAAGVESADDVRAFGKPLAGFSPEMAEEERQLKTFLYAKMYRSAPILQIQNEAKKLLGELFAAYQADPKLLPCDWQDPEADTIMLTRRIGDFVAGMTDRYAITQYRQHIGPVTLPEGF